MLLIFALTSKLLKAASVPIRNMGCQVEVVVYALVYQLLLEDETEFHLLIENN